MLLFPLESQHAYQLAAMSTVAHPHRTAVTTVIEVKPVDRASPLIKPLQSTRGLHRATAASVRAINARTPPFTLATP